MPLSQGNFGFKIIQSKILPVLSLGGNAFLMKFIKLFGLDNDSGGENNEPTSTSGLVEDAKFVIF